MPTIGTAVPSAADVSRPDQRPRSVLGSLFRILVLGLLLPARVLGIGLGRGLQVAARLPVFLFRWIGRASLVLIAGILVLLLSLFVVTLVT